MSQNFVDLRSDTVTRPSKGMLDAILAAHVGDDVFGEDPSVNQLEERTAKLFGKEAGVYCPSGTMTKDRKSTRLNSSHSDRSRMPSSA